MKKKLAVLLACLMLLSCLSIPVAAKADFIKVSGESFTSFSGGGGTKAGIEGCLFSSKGATAVYQVNFPQSGQYKLSTISAACYNDTQKQFKADLKIDNVLVGAIESDFIPPGSTAGEYVVNTIFNVEEGVHEVSITTTGDGTHAIISYVFEKIALPGDEVDFSKTTGAYRNIFLPAIIEGENFDLGADGSFGMDGKNDGGKYRETAPIDIYEKTSKDGYYVQLWEGDSVTYTFTVQHDDAYVLKVASKSSCLLNVSFDGNPQSVKKSLSAKTDFTEADIVTVYLSRGLHTVTLEAEGVLMMDYLRFATSNGGEYITLDMLSEFTEEVEDTEKPQLIYKQLYISPEGSDDNTGEATSPFKTIARAKEEVSKINNDMVGDIIVNVAPGYYQLTEAEVFTPEHGGKNGYNVIFKGESRTEESVISGGTRVTNWKQTEIPEIYKADAKGVTDARTFYVNGYPAQRARSKYLYEPLDVYNEEGSPYKEDGFTVAVRNFPEFEHPEDLEFVWRILWTHQREPVADIRKNEDNTYTVLMDQPYWDWARTALSQTCSPSVETPDGIKRKFYMENAKELLNEPGEFYFDKREQVVYYYPFNEEDLTTAETYLGTSEMMMKIQGTSSLDKVSNLVFDNLSFKYGAWNDVSRTGKRTVQADKILAGPNETDEVHNGAMVPGQIQLNFAQNVGIQNCSFSCLGSGAISVINGVTDSKINGNLFRDISGTAVFVGHWDHGVVIKPDMERTSNIEITNNVIRRPGIEFTDTCGLSVYYADNIKIHHNTIMETPYSGMTIGWGWGWTPDIIEGSTNVDISYNHVEDTGFITGDGSHIYTLGNLSNSKITNNYLSKQTMYIGGIYLDRGSRYLDITDNVIAKSPSWGWVGILAKEDVFSGNFTDMDPTYMDSLHNQTAVEGATVENTTYVSDGDFSKYDKAVEIINNAGVTAPYRRLLGNLELPEWRTNFTREEPVARYVGENGWVDPASYVDFKETEDLGYNIFHPDLPDVVSFIIPAMGCIGDTVEGEWVEYEVTIPESKNYRLILQGGTAVTEIETLARIYVDGEVLTDVSIPNFTPGKWDTGEIDAGEFYMEKGVHKIKLENYKLNFMIGPFKFDDGIERTVTDAGYDESVIVPDKTRKESDTAMFSDVIGHWAEKEIVEMAEKGVIRGISETEFAPNADVTLYQAIWLSLRAANLPHTDDNWKQVAVEYKMLNSDDEIDGSISRERFADIVMKAYLATKEAFTINPGAEAYSDLATADSVYVNAILGAKDLSLMRGTPENKFLPKDNLTRAESAAVIKRLYDLF